MAQKMHPDQVWLILGPPLRDHFGFLNEQDCTAKVTRLLKNLGDNKDLYLNLRLAVSACLGVTNFCPLCSLPVPGTGVHVPLPHECRKTDLENEITILSERVAEAQRSGNYGDVPEMRDFLDRILAQSASTQNMKYSSPVFDVRFSECKAYRYLDNTEAASQSVQKLLCWLSLDPTGVKQQRQDDVLAFRTQLRNEKSEDELEALTAVTTEVSEAHVAYTTLP